MICFFDFVVTLLSRNFAVFWEISTLECDLGFFPCLCKILVKGEINLPFIIIGAGMVVTVRITADVIFLRLVTFLPLALLVRVVFLTAKLRRHLWM